MGQITKTVRTIIERRLSALTAEKQDTLSNIADNQKETKRIKVTRTITKTEKQ